MHDVLIIGGGVIGLSLAWDLARHGKSVQVVDQSEVGREASWAGAGILPAAKFHAGRHPYEQLAGLAVELHPEWAAELKAVTGIDTGYRRCGGLHLARTAGEAAALAAWAAMMRDEGVEVRKLGAGEVASELGEGSGFRVRGSGEAVGGGLWSKVEGRKSKVPVLSTKCSVLGTSMSPLCAYLVPEEAQLRNPWHLRALVEACAKSGVEISPNAEVGDVSTCGAEVVEVQTTRGALRAREYCFTAGAWTGQLLYRVGIATGILPIRGQMLLFRCERPAIRRIINEGSRYLVPREDGRVLAGSTEEEVGFDKRTTEEAIAELVGFARAIVPALGDAEIEKTWAGLRPGSFDGFPYLGRLPGFKNASVAAGHFRSGLFLSPATAVVMSELIRGQKPRVELAAFRVGR